MTGSEIRALSKLLDRIDYYRLMRVERAAPAHEVRSAYQAMRREFHPDRHRAQDEDVRDAIDRIAKRLNEAFAVLRSDTRRQAYDRGLTDDRLRYTAETDDEVKVDTIAAGGTTPNGRKFFALCREAERLGDVEKAVAQLKMALTFEAKNPFFKAKLEDLESRLPKSDGKAKKNAFAIR